MELISDVTLTQLSSSTSTVPSGLYLLYGSCNNSSKGERTARQLLEPLINKLFTLPLTQPQGSSDTGEDEEKAEKEKPPSSTGHEEDTGQIVSCYYLDKRIKEEDRKMLPYESNQVFLLSPPRASEVLDYECSIEEAKRVFTTMFPDCDFLAKAPDSEDIIFDEDVPCSPEST